MWVANISCSQGDLANRARQLLYNTALSNGIFLAPLKITGIDS